MLMDYRQRIPRHAMVEVYRVYRMVFMMKHRENVDMLKKLALVLTLALALVVVPFAASAQSLDDQKNTVQQSGIQIQNLSGETANVSVRYVPAVGASGSAVTQNVTVAPNASLTLLSFGEPQFAAPAGFRGSVVLESDQPILALTNLTNSNFSIAEGYPGFRQGATSVRVPLVVRNNIVPGGRASTAIAVQNTGSANTTVTVNYVSGGVFGNKGTIPPDTQELAAGQSVVFSQADKADLADPAATGDAAGRFIGSATVTSSGGVPIAVTVQQEGNGQLGSYAGFTVASPTVALPLVVAHNTRNQDFTGLQIQNAGTTPTNITFRFSNNQVSAVDPSNGTPVTTVCGNNGAMVERTFSNVAPGQSITLISTGLGGDATPDPSAPIDNLGFDPQFRNCLYIGSAIVDGGGQNIVAIVNQARLGATKQSSAYEGFTSAEASFETRTPLVAAGNFGLLTGVQVQNPSTTAANVTIEYSANTAAAGGGLQPCVAQPVSRSTSIPAGSSFTFLQFGGNANEGLNTIIGTDGQFTNCRYIGSATVRSTGGRIVAVVNQVNLNPAPDSLTTYNGFNQ